MATIKAFTDLQQSMKLAKILPIESADMKILPFTEREYRIVPINDIAVCGREDEIYAWSLAALLELLPKRLEIVDNVYELSVCFYGLYYWNINNGSLCFESKDKDNFVDACCELIIKLKELNLL